MPDVTEDILTWIDKYMTHSNRFKNVMIAMGQVLVEKQEGDLLVDLGECMTATGEDIIELMEILKEHARSTNP